MSEPNRNYDAAKREPNWLAIFLIVALSIVVAYIVIGIVSFFQVFDLLRDLGPWKSCRSVVSCA